MNSETGEEQSPLGVPLSDVAALLQRAGIEVHWQGSTLFAQKRLYPVRIEVVQPSLQDAESGPIRAVVRIVSDVHEQLQGVFKGRGASMIAVMNSMAALGAMYTEDGRVRIGSRLTLHAADDVWNALHLPLLFETIGCTVEALFGGFRRRLAGVEPETIDSHWIDDDLTQVRTQLERICVCTTAEQGLTAEFVLGVGPGGVAAGNLRTALFHQLTDEPHPELGGGLYCSLQMPHRVVDRIRLERLCLQLNQMEMAAHDIPPHFGAWCPNRAGTNPSYVSFLPNSLHTVPGVAVNVAIWAKARAQWADLLLSAMGLNGWPREVAQDRPPR